MVSPAHSGSDDMASMLQAEAQRLTGLSDVGGSDYLEGLRRIVEGIAAIPGLGPEAQQTLAAGIVLAPLMGRLRTEAGWRDHPEVLGTELGVPVFIVGIPRTGTTALHQLLSVDPQFQVAAKWLHLHPQPRPPRDTWPRNLGYQEVAAASDAMPEALKRTHYVAPDDADECLIPMAQTFVSNLFGSQAAIPAYDEWFLAQDMTPSLTRYADFLRLLGATSPERTWLLKNPSHVLCLDELFAVFPTARVIQTHRDPHAALGSVVSMLAAIGPMMSHERAPGDIARREIPLWAEGMRRARKARQGRESAFVDVDYRRFVDDPVATARDVYRAFDLVLTDDVEQAMREWVTAHPRNQRGEHVFDPEALGVHRPVIDEEFDPYIEEHDLA